jgi:uncharacterized protein YfaP (DUF2135 family)
MIALVALALLASATAAPAGDKPRAAPVVQIDSPAGGWTTERIVKIEGTAVGASGRATLVVNGAPKGLALEQGRFSSEIVLAPGENLLSVVAENEAGVGADAVALHAEAPPLDVKVVLTWDTGGTDVDLHVIDPSGEEVDYSHRESRQGGKLDTDVTTGYGPETFTLANAMPGDYQVRAKYYSDQGHPSTTATVQVILREGTDREERHSFQGVLLKTGEFFQVGTFSIAR